MACETTEPWWICSEGIGRDRWLDSACLDCFVRALPSVQNDPTVRVQQVMSGSCSGALQYPAMQQQPGAPHMQQRQPRAYAGQPAGALRATAQRTSGPVNLSSSYPPVYAQPMGRCVLICCLSLQLHLWLPSDCKILCWTWSHLMQPQSDTFIDWKGRHASQSCTMQGRTIST